MNICSASYYEIHTMQGRGWATERKHVAFWGSIKLTRRKRQYYPNTETKYGRQKRMWTFFRSGTRKHFFNFRWQLTSDTPHLRHRHDMLLTRSTVSSLGGIPDPRERRAYLHDEHFSTSHLPPHLLSASLILAVCRTRVTYQPIMAKLATSLHNSSVIKPSADRCARVGNASPFPLNLPYFL